jgi:hypothetical protein
MHASTIALRLPEISPLAKASTILVRFSDGVLARKKISPPHSIRIKKILNIDFGALISINTR